MTDLTKLVERLRECPWEITDEAADAIEAQAREIAALTARAEAAEAKVARLVRLASIASARLMEVFTHGDHSQSDPGYPAAIKSICDNITAALAEIGGGNG